MCRALVVGLLALGWAALSTAIELTFEMKTEKVSCFHEHMNKSAKFTFEYQVVSGGQYDIDLTLTAPDNTRIYHKERQQYDSIHEEAKESGIYTACFSNAFSTFAHKTIYFDWIRDNEPDNFLPSHHSTLTQLETSLMTIHDRLKVVVDYQTHFRLRESLGRDSAENMNERVMYWSMGEAAVLVLVSIAEVYILRTFFATKRSTI